MAYLNITEVESAITALAAAYPSLCERIALPESSIEGRAIHAMRIGKHPAHVKDAIGLIGGVHAREWGSCEILINLAADLLEAYTTSAGLTYGGKSYTADEVKGLVEELNWVILPLVNPDGRNHSQTVDAMWRKNRRNNGDGTFGVDLNRNHDFLWDFRAKLSPSSSAAVSDITSSETYHGSAPLSEPEARNVKWLLDQFPRMRWFMDIHSFSRLILYNWGVDDNQSADPSMNFLNPTYDGLRGVPGDAAYKEFIPANDLVDSVPPTEAMRDAIQAVRGTNYFPGPSVGLYPTTGTNQDYAYCRHHADPSHSKIHGYTVEWGDVFQPPWAEMEEIIKEVDAGLMGFALQAACGGWSTVLMTESIAFNDVPEGQLAARAILFSVNTCQSATFTLDSLVHSTGPGMLGQLPSPSSALPATATMPGARDARIWLAYQATSAGSTATGHAVVRLVETGQTWNIPITANVIAKPTVASMLVLDQSGSMDDASGITGLPKRVDVLRFAAPSFVNLLRQGDGIGVVAFDHDAHDRMAAARVGPSMGNLDTARNQALSAIAAHSTNPSGYTAIGDGLERAHDRLTPLTGYDHKATVVFTDGFETADKRIAAVAGSINERVFAIGLGTAAQIQPTALTSLTNGTGGYLLLTGALNDDNAFLLNKYFMQVLAGVTNQDVVLDPEGYLPPGIKHRIPFHLNEADISVDVILVSQDPPALFEWWLETPDGARVDAATPAVTFSTGTGQAFYRMTLPVNAGTSGAHAGQWFAVLAIDPGKYKSYLDKLREDKRRFQSVAANGLRYSLSVQSFSGLRMLARCAQSSNEPGAQLTLRAALTEYGLPVEGTRASVKATVEEPDGTLHHAVLLETAVGTGVFEHQRQANLDGVYRIRIVADGKTMRGREFTREQLLSAATWKGGDQPPAQGGDDCSPCGWFRKWWMRMFCRKEMARPT